MENQALILFGSAGINIAEYYRQQFARPIPIVLFETHKTDYQAERGAKIINATIQWKNEQKSTHLIESAADLTASYFQGIPDYMQGKNGEMLFFTTAEEQFGNSNFEKTLLRAELYELEIKQILKNYKSIVIIACLGGAVSSAVGPYVAKLANKLHIDTTILVTMPANFEGKKRLAQAQRGLDLFNKKSVITQVKIDPESEGLIRYFKMKDEAIVHAIEKLLRNEE
ncbi:hypothetical protein CSE16_07870 [Solibacillus sp. R5-41]|uniref:hypothetical protein n=1 Tax=Solibacillus sp. R5-41 TaxID=2048654 RepID=UPI000C12690A|nr:hypothetical protein [Solibacillus sp. R5-41]ATP39972.1 hypothetical protein CSE16_07870 [Solibacillus sp. R5-41]